MSSSTYLKLVAILVAVTTTDVMGLESDQFTLPPKPLVDVGPDFERHLYRQVQRILIETNKQIQSVETKLSKARINIRKRSLEFDLARIRSSNFVARQVFETMGRGWPKTTSEIWIDRHRINGNTTTFPVSFKESIYAKSRYIKVLMPLAMSPTIKFHGVYCGADKIGHFFQQGHEYYQVYRQAIDQGHDSTKALRRAVERGVDQEKRFYGYTYTGTYSNADLASNYAGLRFYLNLTERVHVGERTIAPILIFRQNKWVFNPIARKELMRPFVSAHFDESLNPNQYDRSMQESVRSRIAERAFAWRVWRGIDAQSERKWAVELSRWNGEYYGHSGFEELMTATRAILTSPTLSQGESRSHSNDVRIAIRELINPSPFRDELTRPVISAANPFSRRLGLK